MRNKIVNDAEWTNRRKTLLEKEKAFTKLRDELSNELRQLPWRKIDKKYQFQGLNGKISLSDLFGNKSQLIVYHFMFSPEWETGCKSCSIITDSLNPCAAHLAARDVSIVLVSRANIDKLLAFKQRMNWNLNWVSSADSDFNVDFHICTDETNDDGQYYYNYRMMSLYPLGELPGLSVFIKDENGNIFHTYSTYGRGLENFLGTYSLLDVVPKGRDEDQLAWPMEWIQHNDSYDEDKHSECCHR